MIEPVEPGAGERDLLVDLGQRLRHVRAFLGREGRGHAAHEIAGADARADGRDAAGRRAEPALDCALHDAARLGLATMRPWKRTVRAAVSGSRMRVRTSSSRCVGLGRKTLPSGKRCGALPFDEPPGSGP